MTIRKRGVDFVDFSSLVLMQKDKESGFLNKELGSFEVGQGALYVKKFYEIDNKVIMVFDTNKDVEEWEYSAIYDMFDYDLFSEKGYEVEDIDEEFNPTWKVEFGYAEHAEDMKEIIYDICETIDEAMAKVFFDIQDKEEQYK